MLDLLSKAGKLGAKPCSSHMTQSLQLTRERDLFGDPEKYTRLVRKLNHLTITHLDIAHLVSVVNQYTSSLIIDNWAVVKQILHYLKRALRRGILYINHEHNRIECFTYTDYTRSKEDKRAILGYYVFVGGIESLRRARNEVLFLVLVQSLNAER